MLAQIWSKSCNERQLMLGVLSTDRDGNSYQRFPGRRRHWLEPVLLHREHHPSQETEYPSWRFCTKALAAQQSDRQQRSRKRSHRACLGIPEGSRRQDPYSWVASLFSRARRNGRSRRRYACMSHRLEDHGSISSVVQKSTRARATCT